MGIFGEIKQVKAGDELHTCPECGYDRGFHCSFVHMNAGKDGKENPVKSTRDLYRVILVCPECGARFDVGWKIPLTDEIPHVVKTFQLPP
ncbi:MAG: hypothetical protein LUQ31_00225 [Methanoregula sp.]|nr:hypothetical protein [Methanoregula sp.]